MQQALGMVGVWLDVDARHEEEFNAWYELEHVADILAIDGFLSGHRYHGDDGPLRYLVLYEAVDENVEPGPGFQGIVARPSPWTTRMRTLFGERRRRSNFRRIADSGAGAHAGAIVTVDMAQAADTAEGAARRAQFAGCSRYRAFHVAGEPQRGFEIYDFANSAAARAAAAAWPAAAGQRVAVMSATGAPQRKAP